MTVATTPDLYEWTKWLGLPHEIEADPRDGRAACCVKVAHNLLTNAGLPTPVLDPRWFDEARAGHWSYCQWVFQQFVEPSPEPDLWSVAWVTNGPVGFGIGTVVQDNKLLIPHHRRGVTLIPIQCLRKLEYFRVKQ